ncbi:MAG: hypothetical protein EXR78_07080 [Deltaproteobacteria bacterium]|nr:hypothetical protein [Deltaproteobacteria bacterium]
MMSYMRGDIYIWADSVNVHFWSRDGYDSWDDAVWNSPDRAPGAYGVALPQVVADEYVVMRMAEMLNEGCVVTAIEQALRKFSGNGGCLALAEHSGVLREVATKIVPKRRD